MLKIVKTYNLSLLVQMHEWMLQILS